MFESSIQPAFFHQNPPKLSLHMSKVKTVPKLCLDLDSPRGELVWFGLESIFAHATPQHPFSKLLGAQCSSSTNGRIVATECNSTRCNAPRGAAQVCYTSPVIFCSPTRSMGNVTFLSQICTCTHESGSSTPGAAGR